MADEQPIPPRGTEAYVQGRGLSFEAARNTERR